ncbi:MAG: hypothetical protein PF503_10260 [Desulfobacula sp.]|nr:hypothetical protein [Desulfobacula sp.]
MAAKKKRKNKRLQHKELEDILAGRVSVTALELIRLIRRINPTKKNIAQKETEKRYRIKAQLQSLFINKFKNNLQVIPDPNDERLVSLKLKHFDENACHAMVSELDDQARSWIQIQMNLETIQYPEFRNSTPVPSGMEDTKSPAKTINTQMPLKQDVYSSDELLALGAKALEAYDYNACEDFLSRAFSVSQGALPAAQALFEFLVDYLAAYERVIELWDSLAKESRKDSRVSAKQALALARTDRIEEALACLDLSRDPAAMEVYVLGCEYYISQNAPDESERLCKILSSSRNHPFASETRSLFERIEQLRIDQMNPLEKEMLDHWQKGFHDVADSLSEKILEKIPGHKTAKKIHMDFTRMQQEKKIRLFLDQADRAGAAEDFSREVMLLRKALDISDDDIGQKIRARLENATLAAQKQREQKEVHGVASLWQKGEQEKSIMMYVSLSRDQQHQCLALLKDEHFFWTDELTASVSRIKPDKAAEIVLALGKACRMIDNNEDPLLVLEKIDDVGDLVQHIQAGRKLMARAEKQVQAREVEKSKKMLKKAASLLADKRIDQARKCIQTINEKQLDLQNKKELERVLADLEKQVSIQDLERAYTASINRQNYFTARETAQKLARLMPGGQDKIWLKKADEQTVLIKKSMSLVQMKSSGFEPIGLEPSFWKAGITWWDEYNGFAAIMADGHRIVLVSCLNCWLFVRIFDSKTQMFDQAIMMRPPAKMDIPTLRLDEDKIWICGGKGGVLSITLDPLDILFWKDCSIFVKKNHVLEDIWLFPRQNNIWLHYRSLELSQREAALVINLEQQREVRAVWIDGVPWMVNQRGEYHLCDSALDSDVIKIYSGSGKQETLFTKKLPGAVEGGTMHPDGIHLVFLIYDDQDMDPFGEELDETDTCLYLEVVPIDTGHPITQKIPGSRGEMANGIATSMETGLVFVHYYNNINDEYIPCLSAFKPIQDGFEELYMVRVPKGFIFVTDHVSNKVAGVASGENGIQSVLIDQKKPWFDLSDCTPKIKRDIPLLEQYFPCKMPTGKQNDEFIDYGIRVQISTIKDVRQIFYDMKQKDYCDPDDVFAFHAALLVDQIHLALSTEIEKWVSETFPDHPRTLMVKADHALKNQDWPRIVVLLKEVKIQDLDDGTAGHICHLLGLGLFFTGEVKEAVKVWRRGKNLKESRCMLDQLISYGRIAAMSYKQREKTKKKGTYPKILHLIETLDTCLELGHWEDAVAGITPYDIESICYIQILARLTEAFMHQTTMVGKEGWFKKIIVLDLFCREVKSPLISRLILPPYIITWPEKRINELVDRSAAWLEQ